ncbi:uncharacterized protein TOT_030000682 [Theileria orientalis strain Shintoku]|uniref:Iron hydrogenase large subunit C-terminal domain-containing protein n=1 Tax=Theileria orientalis strain Shintoku TaxID=869250 RepID=J4C420_THEOR|nr:uncharacterized protein TOT_030000682 [Theileria orientalis strain Shintoku]BAM41421.1 uncharacterized protein TOT_030000682 [Theileria orientalis strain Shintoku]|eukprot:XP_009691722.1 uncharacterized protein TOT_030000682 [Theileria orientalis strain Shintoku]
MYSNAVKIGGLNDYLSPSADCVLPLIKKDEKCEIKLNDKTLNLDRHADQSFKSNVLKEDIYANNKLKVTRVDKNNKISVGLSDCLSCSGCLTSSEEILLKDDNYSRVVEKMKESNVCVASISPQTVFMYSSYYDMEAEEVLQRLSYLFRKLGAKLVFDIGFSELLALNLSKKEFMAKYQRKQTGSTSGSPNHTKKDAEREATADSASDENRCSRLPIISSHCPGWTLYAEKTLDQDLVDKISEVPSSQIIQGLLVKILCHTMNYYRRIYNINYFRLFYSLDLTHDKDSKNDKVYHVCIVPCYDKKFETIRTEYQIDFNSLLDHKQYDSKDQDQHEQEKNEEQVDEKESIVDDILSTSDVQKILDDMNIRFEDLKKCEIDYLVDYTYYFNRFMGLRRSKESEERERFRRVRENDDIYDSISLRKLIRSSELYCESGGFAEEIFKWACKEIHSKSIKSVEFKQTINSDFKECVLYDSNNEKVLLRFIIAYGFKNVKNVIKMLKTMQSSSNRSSKNDVIGGSRLDYIELMSCPGGCFNGAGQAIVSKRKAERGLIESISKYAPAELVRWLKTNDGKDVETLSSNSLENFIKQTTYANTDNTVCEYFASLIKTLEVKYRLKSMTTTNTNINLQW